MKKQFANLLTATAVALVTAFALQAKEIEQISIVENETINITVPFALKSYSPSNRDVCRIEDLGGGSLRLTALRKGRCDLHVSGDNGLARKYEISVVGDLASVLETLTMDLDTVPEVRAEIRGGYIRLDGELNSIPKWNYLLKVLATYGGVIRNFVRFDPGPESLERLRITFDQAGFKVQFKSFAGVPAKWPYNTVALALDKKTRVLSVQANCLKAEQRERIMSILSAEPWLFVGDGKSAPPQDYMIRTMLNLPIAEPIIRIGVAYLAIGDSDTASVGTSGVPELGMSLSYFADLAHGGRSKGDSAVIGASLDETTRFLAQNGISRMSNKGYALLKSWDEKGANFKSGGTFYVRVSGQTSGDLKEVPYGFEVQAVGGLVSEDKVELSLNIRQSGVTQEGGDINRKEDTTQQKLTLRLGKTLAIGGFGQMVDSKTLSGTPVLRHTPVLKWFCSEDNEGVSNRRILFLISPEIVDNAKDGAIDVEREINIPVEDTMSKSLDQIEEEGKPFSGFWSWLNWFTF